MAPPSAQLRVMHVVGQSFAMLGRAPVAVLGPSLIFFVVSFGLIELARLALGGAEPGAGQPGGEAVMLSEISLLGVLALYLNVLVYNVTACAMLAVAYRAGQGMPPRFAEAMALPAARAPILALITGVETLAAAAIDLGGLGLVAASGSPVFLVLALAALAFLAVQWWLVVPVAASEERDVIGTFRRAMGMVRGHRGAILGVLGVFFAILVSIGMVAGMLLFGAAFGGGEAPAEGAAPSALGETLFIILVVVVGTASNAVLGLASAVSYFEIGASGYGSPDDPPAAFD